MQAIYSLYISFRQPPLCLDLRAAVSQGGQRWGTRTPRLGAASFLSVRIF